LSEGLVFLCRRFIAKKAICRTWFSELRSLKSLEKENRKLKALVAGISVDNQILKDVLSEKVQGLI
jgi:hypothetical protein